jgi:ubiquinone biosynthesis protein
VLVPGEPVEGLTRPVRSVTGVDRRTLVRRTFAAFGVVVVHGVPLGVSLLRIAWRRLRGGAAPGSRTRATAVELRRTISDLGVTATKVGQILSTRPDVLAPQYVAELSKLQDAAPSEPPGVVERVIEAELGHRSDELFADLDPVPLAAASIGQAHAARLPDGTEVVVKVRRPGAVEQVTLDLEILERAGDVATHWSERARRADVRALIGEFSATLRAELDYEQEAANAERFAAALADRPDVHIPRVHRRETTKRVITLDRIHGIKLDDVDALDTAGIDRQELGRRAADVVLTMVFEHRFFHADPHPGNFFVEKDGRLGIIDFGMVGTLDPLTGSTLLALLAALVGGDVHALGDAVTELGIGDESLDRDALFDDLHDLVTTHLERPIGDIELGPVLNAVLDVFRRHRLRFPHNLALLAKTVAMCEGVAATLDPSFRMTTVLAPYVQRLAAEPATGDPDTR